MLKKWRISKFLYQSCLSFPDLLFGLFPKARTPVKAGISFRQEFSNRIGIANLKREEERKSHLQKNFKI